LSLLEIEEESVAGGPRCGVTAEAVVDAQGDHVHVLADPVVEETDKARPPQRRPVSALGTTVPSNTRKPFIRSLRTL
jgi:hypothetical protein